jgi:acetyl esterase/lipase
MNRSSACLLAAFFCLSLSLRAQQQTIVLWPNGTPEPAHVPGPEHDPTTDANRIVSGKVTVRITNVIKPDLAVYLADPSKNTHVTAVVFPGGGYDHLAYNIEGTEVCNWLNSIGVNCAVLKYRVPEKGRFPENAEDLEDAQQAMRIVRSHASEWHIDPDRIGVVGFSAGGNLAALLSAQFNFRGKTVPPSTITARPNFQMVIYPGGLRDRGDERKLDPSFQPTSEVSPTFLLQAENDVTAHVETSLIYFEALKEAKIPAELHVYALGGHGFGLRPTDLPISQWPRLAEVWLRTIHMLGSNGELPPR